MTDNRDERLNLPSASSFETDVLCPGRQNILKTLPPEAFQQAPDEEADRGTRIHKLRETANTATSGDYDEEDWEIYQKGMASEIAAYSQWKDDFQLEIVSAPVLEERIYIHWPDTMAPATSARLDVFHISGTHGLIIEWKSLWCTNLTPAEKNWQGRLQAVLLANEYNLNHVRVVFNKAMFGKIDCVDYTENDLRHSEQSIFHALYETKNPYAQRRAGPWCRYCPARGKYCPESAAMALLPTTIIRDVAPVELSPLQIAERMSPEDLVAVWTRSGTIVKILDAIKDRLKNLPPEELSRLGLQLADGRKMDKITKTKECFEYLKTQIAEEDEIWRAMSFGKGDVVLAIMRALGTSKPKAIGMAGQLVEKFGETNYAAKSLERS
jgi:hypothetical protein